MSKFKIYSLGDAVKVSFEKNSPWNGNGVVIGATDSGGITVVDFPNREKVSYYRSGGFMPYALQLIGKSVPATPKVGDTIKAQQQDSVIHGEITELNTYTGMLAIRTSDTDVVWINVDNWNIEIIKPKVTLPTKRYAMIIFPKTDENMFVLDGYWFEVGTSRSYIEAELLKQFGDVFRVIFEGEDA